jgi:hypothetical protein
MPLGSHRLHAVLASPLDSGDTVSNNAQTNNVSGIKKGNVRHECYVSST